MLEVLISIGVLLIGLLGVAALIPVGARAISQTARADRASACARAASHDVLVRNMLDRTQWYYVNSNPPTHEAFNVGPYALDAQLLGQTLVIDPLQIAVGLTAGVPAADLEHLPCGATAFPFLPRLEVQDPGLHAFIVGGGAPASVESYYRRLFTWSDDQLFEMPEERDRRPRQFFTMANGDFGSDTAGASLPAVRQSDGNYSWFITAMPSAAETPPEAPGGGPDTTALQRDHQRTYTVSVAVFYKRDLDLTAAHPPERWVEVRSAAGGTLSTMISDVQLVLRSARTADFRAEYLDIKQNQWILLCAQKQDLRLPTTTPQRRTIAQWYRVIAADEPVEDTTNHIWTRCLTLAGPDWDPAFGLDDNGDGAIDPAEAGRAAAILLDGVIDVHTTTVEVGE